MSNQTRKGAIAGESLVGHQYRAAQYDSSDSYEVDKCTSSGAAGFCEAFAGSVINEAGDARPVTIGLSGIAKVDFGGAVSPGHLVMPSTDGKYVRRTPGFQAIGRVLPELRGGALRSYADTKRGEIEILPVPLGVGVDEVSATFGAIANGAGATQTATINGLTTGDSVNVQDKAGVVDDGLIAKAWVSAANTLSIRLFNTTGAPITPNAGGAITFVVGIIKA